MSRSSPPGVHLSLTVLVSAHELPCAPHSKRSLIIYPPWDKTRGRVLFSSPISPSLAAPTPPQVKFIDRATRAVRATTPVA